MCFLDQCVVTENQVQKQFLKFSSSNTSLSDEPRPGYSSDIDEDALWELMECSMNKSTCRFDYNIS